MPEVTLATLISGVSFVCSKTTVYKAIISDFKQKNSLKNRKTEQIPKLVLQNKGKKVLTRS